jgi:hypothetical protein
MNGFSFMSATLRGGHVSTLKGLNPYRLAIEIACGGNFSLKCNSGRIENPGGSTRLLNRQSGDQRDTEPATQTKPIMKKRSRFFRAAYSNPNGDQKRPRLHQIRDGAAFCELSASLVKAGFEYATVVHFYPGHRVGPSAFNFIRSGDLVVLTTRPPIDDYLGDARNHHADRDRRLIQRSGHQLEEAIFSSLKPSCFSWVSRYCVELSPEMAGGLPEERRNMANLEFHKYGNGRIQQSSFLGGPHAHYRRVPKPRQHAVGYFAHLPKIKGFPCGLILSFSMGGYENLLWNRIVRLKFKEWLTKPVFAVVELELPEEPSQPLTPELADRAPMSVLLEQWL